MSITRSQRARLGIFVVAGAVLLGLFAAIPLGVRLTNRQKLYYAYFEGESLSGLEQGAVVKYHGIPIGKIDKISYDPGNINRVKVTLKVQHNFPLKVDMYAQTGMMGITGLMYLDVLGGSNDAAMLKPESEIPTRPSMISAITGKAESIVAKVELLLNHLTVLTHPDSLNSIKEILDNVAVVTGDARSFMDNVRPNLEQMAASSQNVLSMVDSISSDIRVLTSEIRGSVAGGRLSTILTSIDSTSQSLRSLSQTLDLTLKQSREDIAVSMENLRETLENANEISKIVAENPSLLLRGEQQKERVIR